MTQLLETIVPLIPEDKPIHLLGTLLSICVSKLSFYNTFRKKGIGDEVSLDACAHLGIDTFDSSFPTRAGRHGNLFTK
jgi:queuine tRNA-ribosyltransferase